VAGRRADLTSTLPKRFQLWLALNRDVFHLPKLMAWISGFVLILVGAIWLMLPHGSRSHTTGTLVGLGFLETEQGSVSMASVVTDRGMRRITLPMRYDCRIGDVIRLRRTPTRFGEMVSVERVPEPCTRGKAPLTSPR